MIKIKESERFRKISRKLDGRMKDLVEKRVRKILENQEVGKPMRYGRKGTREVYVGHFRLSYIFLPEEKIIMLLDFYHKDEQ